MTKISLTDDLKHIALQQYHPYIVIELWSLEQEDFENTHQLQNIVDVNEREIIIQDAVNLKIIEDDIEKMLQENELKEYQKFVSKPTDVGMNQGSFDNIIFTPYNDLDTIIPYEYYNGVFYLRLPRFYYNICLHILTKYFDATDDVVLFTTEDAINYINDENTPSEKWLSSGLRDDNKINILNDNVGRYLIDLPNELKHAPSIEIDVFYKYLNNIQENQIGVIDTNDRGYNESQNAAKYEDQKTLIENNKNLTNSTNQIITAKRNQEDITTDSAFTYSNASSSNDTFKLSTNHEPNKIYELIVKYINDNIYIEEYNQRLTEEVNRIEELQTNDIYNYKVGIWTEE